MRTFQDMQGLPCVEFVEWLEHNERDNYLRIVRNVKRYFCDEDCCEAWSSVLIVAWKQNLTADYFDSYEKMKQWMMAIMMKAFRFMAINYVGQRRKNRKDMMGMQFLISELESEQVRSFIDNFESRSAAPTELGPSKQWFTQAMEMLTPKQKASVEMMVLAGLDGGESARLGGWNNYQTVHEHRDKAIKRIRQAIESGELQVA